MVCKCWCALLSGLGSAAEEGKPLLWEEQEEVLCYVREPANQWHFSGVHSRSRTAEGTHTPFLPSCEVQHSNVCAWPGWARQTPAGHKLHRSGWGEWGFTTRNRFVACFSDSFILTEVLSFLLFQEGSAWIWTSSEVNPQKQTFKLKYSLSNRSLANFGQL